MTAASGRRGSQAGWCLGHAAHVPSGDEWLTDAERTSQERFVVPKRRADWRLGRWTAKTAVSAWTGGARREHIGILARSGDDGYPVVEGAGTPAPRLSLTHRGELAVAVVAPAGTAVGCDLELVEPRPERFCRRLVHAGRAAPGRAWHRRHGATNS